MSGEVEHRATIEAFRLAYNEERLGDCIKIYAPEARLRHPSLGISIEMSYIFQFFDGMVVDQREYA